MPTEDGRVGFGVVGLNFGLGRCQAIQQVPEAELVAVASRTEATAHRVGEQLGVAAYADYPSGEPWTVDPSILVHKGTFELRIALERTGPIIGQPLISITYQACTDTECLEPVTVELDVALDT